MHACHCEYFHYWDLHSSKIHVRYIQLMDFITTCTLYATIDLGGEICIGHFQSLSPSLIYDALYMYHAHQTPHRFLRGDAGFIGLVHDGVCFRADVANARGHL